MNRRATRITGFPEGSFLSCLGRQVCNMSSFRANKHFFRALEIVRTFFGKVCGRFFGTGCKSVFRDRLKTCLPALVLFVTAMNASARVNVVTLPGRDSVQLTIYNT